MIRTVELTKDYGGGRGIRGLNLHVPQGRICGYIGPNGAGKTTTIKLLCGLLRPSSGQAFVNGIEVTPQNSRAVKRLIGYLPDEFGVYEQMTVWEYLDFFGAAYRLPRATREARIREVMKLADATHMLDYQVASLSRGMHQRIGLAKTLLHDPAVLILDEPAAGLDPYARVEMRRTIQRLRDLGKTILLSSHILPELASVCDLVGILEKGQLVACGSVREITARIREHVILLLSVDSDVGAALRLCRDFAAVEEAAASGDEIRLVFSGTHSQVADLNAMLVENGVRVLGLRQEETDLEQVYLSVTGH